MAVTSRSPRRMRPDDGANMPHITLINVVLPAPLGPITPSTSPEGTWNEIPSKTFRPPNCLAAPSIRSACAVSVTAASDDKMGTGLILAPLEWLDSRQRWNAPCDYPES